MSLRAGSADAGIQGAGGSVSEGFVVELECMPWLSPPTMRRRPARWLFLCGVLAGCGGGASPVGAQARSGVTFHAFVDGSLFAGQGALQVRVWNAAQLADLERTSGCGVEVDPATGGQRIHCPDGTTLEPVTPEEFEFPLRDVGGSVTFRTSGVRAGERFRIALSGASRDGCNTTSADRSGVAGGADVVLEGLAWSTTARACLGR